MENSKLIDNIWNDNLNCNTDKQEQYLEQKEKLESEIRTLETQIEDTANIVDAYDTLMCYDNSNFVVHQANKFLYSGKVEEWSKSLEECREELSSLELDYESGEL